MEKKLKSWQGWLLFGGSMVVVFVLGLCVSALMERRAEVASIFNNRKTVIKGIEILEKGEAFPKAPVTVEEEVTKDKKDGKKKRTAQAYSITEGPTRGFNYAKTAIS
jgi:hypothetical protein